MVSVSRRTQRWLATAVALASLTLSGAPASAGPRAQRVEWSPSWHRVRPWEYATTAATLGWGFYLRFGAAAPSSDWRGGVLFDDGLLDAVAIEGHESRRSVAKTTDNLFYGAMAYRLVDSALLPWLIHGSPDVALQMSMIDLQAFGVVASVLWSVQVLVGRERPVVTRRCPDPAIAASEPKCDPDSAERNRSLIAGHPAVGITAAGLTCLHHAHLPLYGRDGDILACGLMIGAATFNGLGRVMTEQHYPSDLVLGVGLGVTAGYVIPSALHYGFGSGRRPETSMVVIPFASDQGVGANLAGIF
jgi:membrane-associated phospholipid phosphatase